MLACSVNSHRISVRSREELPLEAGIGYRYELFVKWTDIRLHPAMEDSEQVRYHHFLALEIAKQHVSRRHDGHVRKPNDRAAS